ncbi:MAG: hypothetical protein A4S08_04805 [Proteobacteria bacterium SG_bin4]|nr:MAG: hypothetical protein A4S08_04805 [Proteobacteria bacterium SG_bin4]
MSFPRYEKYKDSGVEWLGEVPEHWDVRRIKYVLTKDGYKAGPFGSSLITSELSDEGDILVLTPEHVAIESLDLPFNQYLKESRRNEMAAFFVNLNDVVFPIVGTLGRAMIISVPKPGILNQRLARMSTDIKKILPAYLKLMLTDVDFYKRLDEVESKGAILNHITKEKLINRPVLTPPINEQNQILSFLRSETAKIDELIAEQQRLLELLKEKRQAVISHAVTKGLNPSVPMKDSGIEWLGEVPEHWNVKQLRHIAKIVRGASPRPAGDPKFFSSGNIDGSNTPWVTVAEITKDEKAYLSDVNEYLTSAGVENSQFFEAGTLIFTNSGATLGVPKILAINCCANDGVLAFKDLAEKVDVLFVYHFLSTTTERLRTEMKQGGGQPNLNTDIVKNLSIAVPPLSEQSDIVAFLSNETARFYNLTVEANRAIELLQERRAALISAAVTGKIDVRSLVTDKLAVE